MNADTKEYRRQWQRANPDKVRGYWRKYRATEKGREAMRRQHRRLHAIPEPTRPRPKLCEACDRPSEKALHVDHCHLTGEFRGWLCFRCNVALGNVGDSRVILRALITYLDKVQA